MAIAKIGDIWVPDIWIRSMNEKLATFPSILSSKAVTRNAELDSIASGPGTSANIPFYKDITDQEDEIQTEDTAPVSTQGITTGKMVATILNRQTKNGASAFSGQLSGTDPVGEITAQMQMRRQKQRNKTIIATLRGAFGATEAANVAAALSAVRLGGTTAEDQLFDESGEDATDQQKMSPDMFIDLKSLMGELAGDLSNGLLLLHTNVKARLEKLDALNFKTGKPSDLPFTIQTYRDIPIMVSDRLVRAGTTNGFVYDTYLIGPGVIGWGEKAQAGDSIDVASLQLDQDKDKNNEYIYDRTRFLVHINGLKWVGTPGGDTATNAELQVAASWELVYTTANRCGVVCVRTNG